MVDTASHLQGAAPDTTGKLLDVWPWQCRAASDGTGDALAHVLRGVRLPQVHAKCGPPVLVARVVQAAGE